MKYELVKLEPLKNDTTFNQTIDVFERASIYFPNVVRMWVGLNDIDNNYLEFSAARNGVYNDYGYHKGTRTFASTCVGSADKLRLVILVAQGINKNQIIYTDLKSHLPHTNIYNVSFERSCRIEYKNQYHHFVSGTASIDKNGDVLHLGDVVGQVRRLWEVIGGLLHAQCAGLNDIIFIGCYIRNENDIDIVKNEIESMGFINPSIDICYNHAEICRKDWLVECECFAVTYKS